MAIWKTPPTPNLRDRWPFKNMADHLGIEIEEAGDDYLIGKMPVDERTRQPYGLLHGGASCVLAETLGSVAATLCIDMERQIAVGIEINANHIRSVSSGFVFGKVTTVHIGRSTQVWDIRITDDQQQLVCVSRLTLAIKDLKR